MPANSSPAAPAVTPYYARRVRIAVCSAPTATHHAHPSSRKHVRADTCAPRIQEGLCTSEHTCPVLLAWCCSSCWCSQPVVRHRLPQAPHQRVPQEHRSTRRRLRYLPTFTDRMTSKPNLIKIAVCHASSYSSRRPEGPALLGPVGSKTKF